MKLISHRIWYEEQKMTFFEGKSDFRCCNEVVVGVDSVVVVGPPDNTDTIACPLGQLFPISLSLPCVN